MIRYLKFDENGDCIAEAPNMTVRNGKLIVGYNKPINEPILLEDGWLKYEGFKDRSHIKLVDGEIIEVEDEAVPIKQTMFTKLQIRRAMRKMGIESQLDAILEGNAEVAKDWNDAQVIDLNDGVFRIALTQNELSDEFIDTIIENIEAE